MFRTCQSWDGSSAYRDNMYSVFQICLLSCCFIIFRFGKDVDVLSLRFLAVNSLHELIDSGDMQIRVTIVQFIEKCNGRGS